MKQLSAILSIEGVGTISDGTSQIDRLAGTFPPRP